MERVESVAEAAGPGTAPAEKGKLLRIPGIGFGLAIFVGGTVGVGILRSTADDHFPDLSASVSFIVSLAHCGSPMRRSKS